MARIAVVRIRGQIGINRKIYDTLKMMHLFRRNSCAIIKDTPSNIGMINLIKDYVTWGEVNEITFTTLLKSRGKLPGNKKLTEEYINQKLKFSINDFSKEFFDMKKELKDIPGLKPYFRLTPPLKGFENKGIKVPFSQGGSLGYRKDKINELIMRMI